MRKLFFALMAALVLASCGSKKDANELAKELTPVLTTATESLKKAQSGSDVIAAIDKLVADEAAIVENYPVEAFHDFSYMAQDEFEKAHPENGPAYFKAHFDFINALYSVEDLVDEEKRQGMWEKRHTTKVI